MPSAAPALSTTPVSPSDSDSNSAANFSVPRAPVPEDDLEPAPYTLIGPRQPGVPSGYGREPDRRPLIVGFTLIGLVMLVVVLGGVWWQYRDQLSLEAIFGAASPTPTPVIQPPIISTLPVRTPEPLVIKTLGDFFDQEEYQIAYTIVYNQSDSLLATAKINSYTVSRSGNQVLIEVPDYEEAALIDFTQGMVYDIAHASKQIFVDPGALHTVLDSYLIVDPAILTDLLQEGQETWDDITYRTETYPGVTAFFSNNELVYLRDDDLGIIHQVLLYSNEVSPDIFVLPPTYQIIGAET
jgi:hypothetical protein